MGKVQIELDLNDLADSHERGWVGFYTRKYLVSSLFHPCAGASLRHDLHKVLYEANQ